MIATVIKKERYNSFQNIEILKTIYLFFHIFHENFMLNSLIDTNDS